MIQCLCYATLRFAAAVVMSVTYGYDINGKETFVDLMQRAGDIFLAVVTPELSAVCAAFPFSGCFRSKFVVSCLCFNGCLM